MSQLPVPIDFKQIPTSPHADDKIFSMISGASFLPRIQLMTFMSKPVKQQLIKPGHYGLIRNKVCFDLGDEFTALPVAVRALALDMSDETAPIFVFDHKSQEFADIAARVGESNSSCQAGPQYLIWIPKQGWVSFLFGNPTLRRSAPEVLAFMNAHKAVLFRSREINRGTQDWHGAVVNVCSDFDFTDFPTQEEVNAQVTKFINPPKREVEVEVAQTSTPERPR